MPKKPGSLKANPVSSGAGKNDVMHLVLSMFHDVPRLHFMNILCRFRARCSALCRASSVWNTSGDVMGICKP